MTIVEREGAAARVVFRRRVARFGCAFLVASSLLASIGEPVQADSRRSVVTSLANAECRFERGSGPGSEEAQSKTCRGLAGGRPVVDATGTRVALGFDWAAGPVRRQRRVVVGWSLGEALDWRGTGAGARFRPDAAIVRILFNDDGPQVRHQVLAIMTLRPGQACLRAVVDATANASPYEIARRAADDPAPFACGTDRARTVGIATEWTARVVEGSGAAPE